MSFIVSIIAGIFTILGISVLGDVSIFYTDPIDTETTSMINNSEKELSPNEKNEILEDLKQEGIRFYELWLFFNEKDIEVLNSNGECEYLFGKEIENLDSATLKLVNKEYQIAFDDYSIEKRMVYGREKTVAIFHDVPRGHYNLQTSIDGYEYLITEDMILSTEYLQGDVNDNEAYWGRSIYMTKNDATRVFPYYIKVFVFIVK